MGTLRAIAATVFAGAIGGCGLLAAPAPEVTSKPDAAAAVTAPPASSNEVVQGPSPIVIDADAASDADAGPVDPALPIPPTEWAHLFGGTELDVNYRFALDAAGNVIVIGLASTSITLGGTSYTCKSSQYVSFMMKLLADGTFAWAHGYCASVWPGATGIGVDAQGNIFVGGTLMGTADFGGGKVTITSTSAGYVVGYDANGDYQWQRLFQNENLVEGNAFVLDDAGRMTLVGTFAGSTDFGDGAVLNESPYDVFAVTLDRSGKTLGTSTFVGASKLTWLNAAAVDPMGNVALVGTYEGTGFDMGGGALPDSEAGWRTFVVSLDANRGHRFSRAYGPTSQGLTVATDHDGNVAFAGNFVGVIDVGAGAVDTGGASYAGYVARLDANGNGTWAKALGTEGHTVAFLPGGDVVVAYQPGVAPHSLGIERLVSATGATRWDTRFGGGAPDFVNALASDPAGDLYFSGTLTSDSIDVGTGALKNSGNDDVFVGKLGL